MFENTIQTNGTQSWKWVTISGRVFVDNAELETVVADTDRSAADIFERLAEEKLRELFPTDDPFKLNSVDFN